MNSPQPPIARRTVMTGLAAALGSAAVTHRADAFPGVARPSTTLPAGVDRGTLLRWAEDTWRSLVAMTPAATGLPADNITGDLATRSGYTSPTNIGGYMWSAVVARELGIISRKECVRRVTRTLRTLLTMEHHQPSGMYYNWYDEATGEAIRSWPGTGARVYPFVSSVDNGWLGAALWVVRNSVPEASRLARRLFGRMRWDAFYNPEASRPGGLLHGGFFTLEGHDRPGGVYLGTHIGGEDVWLTTHHYDTIVSETRITSYLGIMTGQIPAKHYFAAWRTFPATCDWSWHEMQPVGVTRTYLGIQVYEGAYTYRGKRIVPGWGGSMFEELMPNVFVPEERWGPRSWGENHPLHVRAQIEHGMDEAGYGYWGFSPSSDPFANYREYGVDALGMNPEGYFSDHQKTNYDIGFGECRPATNPNPVYGDGVVTPHAPFLAMMHAPAEAYDNLVRLEENLDSYGPGGFYDAIAVRSGTVARRYLSLDQAMVMGAIGNVAARDVLQRAFVTRGVEKALRPIIAMEEFGSGTA
jgi:hypothetical protein